MWYKEHRMGDWKNWMCPAATPVLCDLGYTSLFQGLLYPVKTAGWTKPRGSRPHSRPLQRQAGPRCLPQPPQPDFGPLGSPGCTFLGTASLPPTPRLTLRGSGSSRKSAVSLKTSTGWAWGTSANTDGGAIARKLESARGSHRES